MPFQCFLIHQCYNLVASAKCSSLPYYTDTVDADSSTSACYNFNALVRKGIKKFCFLQCQPNISSTSAYSPQIKFLMKVITLH